MVVQELVPATYELRMVHQGALHQVIACGPCIAYVSGAWWDALPITSCRCLWIWSFRVYWCSSTALGADYTEGKVYGWKGRLQVN